MKGHEVKITNKDVELDVTDSGSGETTLVFSHHWGGSSKTWSAVIERLRERFRCVAIDARGAGSSSAPSQGFSTQDHASDVQAVIDALELNRYVLVGHSMGGKASQVLAGKRPKGLLGLALIASSPPSPMAIDDTQRGQMKLAYAHRSSVEWTLDNVLLGSTVSDASRQQLIDDAQRLSPQAKAGWIDVGTREDFSSTAAQIDVPVLIVAGELDRVDPVAVVEQHILPRYPAARRQFLANKGHLLPVEAPGEVAQILREFTNSL